MSRRALSNVQEISGKLEKQTDRDDNLERCPGPKREVLDSLQFVRRRVFRAL